MLSGLESWSSREARAGAGDGRGAADAVSDVAVVAGLDEGRAGSGGAAAGRAAGGGDAAGAVAVEGGAGYEPPGGGGGGGGGGAPAPPARAMTQQP
jgi:hypothetical protein